MSQSNNAIYHGKLAVTNSGHEALHVTIEPWADETTIAPGKTARISLSGPSGGQLEIDVAQNGITLYAWEGSVMSLDPQED